MVKIQISQPAVWSGSTLFQKRLLIWIYTAKQFIHNLEIIWCQNDLYSLAKIASDCNFNLLLAFNKC